ncbi:transcription antitermination factor NusB [Melissococcus plutonius]|uniref:Transcription antitermination protein NusB n=1 Tax=Melissococcus plutonius (strain ATCC 35311 / DSM 29964 / CIP 104052 / LMG 20360 / NCIMB 702443) TaxID=940190 RepID=F3Y9P3_MELPT|nr:transcription antitermination factor NusB [Melissococcus plutonius]AIM24759.1 N utilization substance protein B-like protein [Melissococcus plutonius S1]KMT24870.1 N utilization substance protein B-like protein [Melissococcus plutonius]KMT26507.1 N utilization substance protein B-like protein [Melissococcus plutonius]KMT27757.1 N utilization substance protein B-like protein [Melissococcus plutonius]KMT29529.1 N utilization substance protein B-like protein [Melissococcus plutonius]
MNKQKLTRREIREKALQALFPLDFNTELTKQDAIDYALMLDNYEVISEDQENLIPTYLDFLVDGVCSHKNELDQVIKRLLGKNWTFERLSKIDTVILRMAVFEMMYSSDVPAPVALNEALELAKKYSDDNARKFTNGILANVLKEIEKHSDKLSLFEE